MLGASQHVAAIRDGTGASQERLANKVGPSIDDKCYCYPYAEQYEVDAQFGCPNKEKRFEGTDRYMEGTQLGKDEPWCCYWRTAASAKPDKGEELAVAAACPTREMHVAGFFEECRCIFEQSEGCPEKTLARQSKNGEQKFCCALASDHSVGFAYGGRGSWDVAKNVTLSPGDKEAYGHITCKEAKVIDKSVSLWGKPSVDDKCYCYPYEDQDKVAARHGCSNKEGRFEGPRPEDPRPQDRFNRGKVTSTSWCCYWTTKPDEGDELADAAGCHTREKHVAGFFEECRCISKHDEAGCPENTRLQQSKDGTENFCCALASDHSVGFAYGGRISWDVAKIGAPWRTPGVSWEEAYGHITCQESSQREAKASPTEVL